MAVLSALEPKRVFYYFEQICKIPHGTYNTKKISDYCVDFAKEHGLEYVQDETNNVIIRKPATEGYEKSETVILQGHLDMVCEKTLDSTHDFEKDRLELFIEDGYVRAKDTTLGGDDGIAIAMSLAILEANDLEHPALEALFTTEEEVGMDGANNLDMTQLKGRRLINIDSEEEGYLTVGCAGGFRFTSKIPYELEPVNGQPCSITIKGLLGGHSGMEINKQRGNAHVLMGRLLNHIETVMPIRFIDINGGSKDNVISMESKARIVVPADMGDKLYDTVGEMEEIFVAEFGNDDPGLVISVKEDAAEMMFTQDSTDRLLGYLVSMPNGVVCMERAIENQVETSLNIGVIDTTEEGVCISHLVRSSVESKKRELEERLRRIARIAGGTSEIRSEYPAWAYRKESKLRDIMSEVYERNYRKAPEIMTVHAGLECGLFVGKLPDLDCVSFGPDLMEVHSVNERMDINSVARSYQYLLDVLKALK